MLLAGIRGREGLQIREKNKETIECEKYVRYIVQNVVNIYGVLWF